MSVLLGVVMTLCASAYRLISGDKWDLSSSVFLNMGGISANFSFSSGGVKMSTWHSPNRLPSLTALSMSSWVVPFAGRGEGFWPPRLERTKLAATGSLAMILFHWHSHMMDTL